MAHPLEAEGNTMGKDWAGYQAEGAVDIEAGGKKGIARSPGLEGVGKLARCGEAHGMYSFVCGFNPATHCQMGGRRVQG